MLGSASQPGPVCGLCPPVLLGSQGSAVTGPLLQSAAACIAPKSTIAATNVFNFINSPVWSLLSTSPLLKLYLPFNQ